MTTEVRERLANLEHEQWMKWASAVMDEVGWLRQARWKADMIPYEDLPEKVKDHDRKWADEILDIVRDYTEGAIREAAQEGRKEEV